LFSEQPALYSCKAHVFQVDPDTRKSWIPMTTGAGKELKQQKKNKTIR